MTRVSYTAPVRDFLHSFVGARKKAQRAVKFGSLLVLQLLAGAYLLAFAVQSRAQNCQSDCQSTFTEVHPELEQACLVHAPRLACQGC
jgi:hypothetical protein